jgi:hypothetical protein
MKSLIDESFAYQLFRAKGVFLIASCRCPLLLPPGSKDVSN